MNINDTIIIGGIGLIAFLAIIWMISSSTKINPKFGKLLSSFSRISFFIAIFIVIYWGMKYGLQIDGTRIIFSLISSIVSIILFLTLIRHPLRAGHIIFRAGFLIIPILLCIMPVLVTAITFRERETYIRGQLNEHLSEYSNISNLQTSLNPNYIIARSRFIIIDKSSNKIEEDIHPLAFQIGDYSVIDQAGDNSSDNLLNNIDTIIWLECTERIVATYISGAKGYQSTCSVSIIDKAQSTIVGNKVFVGSEPPDTKEGLSDYHGGPPIDKIRDYIHSFFKE